MDVAGCSLPGGKHSLLAGVGRPACTRCGRAVLLEALIVTHLVLLC
jgi:hypothetical protein